MKITTETIEINSVGKKNFLIIRYDGRQNCQHCSSEVDSELAKLVVYS